MSDLYDTDVHSWALAQAEALRRRSANELDWDHLAEEIESLGKSQQRELRSRAVVLLTHLLKWRAQPGLRGASWRITIRLQRDLIAEHLADNPSLAPRAPEAFAAALREARARAAIETGLAEERFAELDFEFEQAMDPDFLPD